jgi:lipopolysaccharide/colanic/teichoic acid biosynthesis glycosyltransferase
MSKYYLEKEKYYWLKFLFDGLLLLSSFLMIYYIKRGHLAIEHNFRKFLPILFLIWFLSTLFSKKFMKVEKQNYFELLKPFLLSALVLVAMLTLIMYVLGWYYLSRFIIYGTMGVFLVLEIAFLSCIFFIFKRESEKKKVNQFSVIFFLIEFAFIIIVFMSLYFYKKGAAKLTENYQVLLMGILFTWLLVSLSSHKFNIVKKENYLKTIFPFIRSEIIIISVISFFIFFFKLAMYSRLIIFGSLGLFSLLEIIIVSVYYIFTAAQISDENVIDIFHAREIEAEKHKFIEDKKKQAKIYDFHGFALKTVSIKEKLKNVYLKKFQSVYKFIENNLNLNRIDILESEVVNTRILYNIEILENSSLAFFLNLHKINNFRRINQYFIEANKKIKSGGVFVGRFESIEQRRKRIYQKYHYVFVKLIYLFDFIYRRVWPKLPFFKKVYFAISKGNNRVLSRAECLGRLHFCGFELIKLQEIDNYTYFITTRIKDPSKDTTPSYGPIFKQRRISKDGKIICIYKLRTMHPYSEYIQYYAYEESELNRRGKISSDFRITSWGRFLRKYYIDELPMIINLFKGDMKLVGVRPLSKTHYSINPEDLKKARIKYKPGLIPPYYVDFPTSIEEFWESERKYLEKYKKNPIRTDLFYFIKSLNNILFHHAKSE